VKNKVLLTLGVVFFFFGGLVLLATNLDPLRCSGFFDSPDSRDVTLTESSQLRATLNEYYAGLGVYDDRYRTVSVANADVKGRDAVVRFGADIPPRGDLSAGSIWYEVYAQNHNGRQRCVSVAYRRPSGESLTISWPITTL
jgi:hypothetical protein